MLGKPHPLGCHAIYVRRGEQFLSVAAKVTVPGIIDHDKNEIRLFFSRLSRKAKQANQQQ